MGLQKNRRENRVCAAHAAHDPSIRLIESDWINVASSILSRPLGTNKLTMKNAHSTRRHLIRYENA